MRSLIDLFKAMEPGKRYGILAVIVALLIALMMFFHFLTQPNMVTLYSNLDPKDSSEIVSVLEARGIAYSLNLNGTQISVPQNMAARMRIDMAAEGIPSTGSIAGYEIFDKEDSFGTSNFVLNVNLQRALEGELAKTISSMQNIESAKVLLVMPRKELFSRDKQKPTASVFLRIKGMNSIGRNEIKAIENLVAAAVPGLSPAMVTIVDNRGAALKIGGADNENGSIYSNNAEDYKRSYENRLQNEIQNLVEMSVGAGKVKVNVAADINFDRIVTNSEIYDPASKVPRSIQNIQEVQNSSDNSGAQPVTVTSNLPNAPGAAAGSQDSSSNSSKRVDEIINYEISKTITNHVNEVGEIKRLSIAVLVDGTYKPGADKDAPSIYQPRTPAELQQIDSLVKSAMGYDQNRNDKLEVINMQFAADLLPTEESLEDWLKSQLSSIIQMLIIGVVVILVILLVIRPVALRAFELSKNSDAATEADIAGELAATGSAGASAMFNDENMSGEDSGDNMAEKSKNNPATAVNNILEKNPQESLKILRKWLDN